MTTPNSPEPLADAANGSVTYGTRSRGRNAPRPNYAEDRDLDMDADASAPSKAAKRNSGVAPPHEEKTSSAQRKSLNGTANAVVNANASANTNGGVAKEAIPGTSSFSARPEDANGSNLRKRKQPSTTTPTSGSAKKIFTSAPGDSDDYFTNMMSFETHGPYLHDGQLIADDGTTFSLDGLFSSPKNPNPTNQVQTMSTSSVNLQVSHIIWRELWNLSTPKQSPVVLLSLSE